LPLFSELPTRGVPGNPRQPRSASFKRSVVSRPLGVASPYGPLAEGSGYRHRGYSHVDILMEIRKGGFMSSAAYASGDLVGGSLRRGQEMLVRRHLG
jgi:hypothetical protein